jgi:hypothetical protein
MKYYLVYLLNGLVIDIKSYDDEEALIERYKYEKKMLNTDNFSLCFDEVQLFDSID